MRVFFAMVAKIGAAFIAEGDQLHTNACLCGQHSALKPDAHLNSDFPPVLYQCSAVRHNCYALAGAFSVNCTRVYQAASSVA